MGRPKISPAQRISDLFCELDLNEQATVITALVDFNRFCKLRDAIVVRHIQQRSAETQPPLAPDWGEPK